MYEYERFLLETIVSNLPSPALLKRVESLITAILQKRKSDKEIDDELLRANPDIELDPQKQISLNKRNYSGDTAILLAAIKGYTEIVAMLIEAGADVNAREDDCYSPLRYASTHGHCDIVRLLIDANADLDFQGFQEVTALIDAAKEGHTDIVRLLIQAKANINIRAKEGATALMHAVAQDHLEAARELVLAKADLEIKTTDEPPCTALDIAVHWNKLMMVSLLLEHGATIRNFSNFQTYLNQQDPTNNHVMFCWGVFHHQLDVLEKAKEFYSKVDIRQCPAAFRRLGECYEEEQDFERAFYCYKHAAKRGNSLSIKRLVTLAQKLFDIIIQSTDKNVAVLFMYQQIMSATFDLLKMNHLHAPLSSGKWIFIAENAPVYFEIPLEGNHLAIRAARLAEETAETQGEKALAEKVSVSAWGLFRQMTNPNHGAIDGQSDHQQQLEVLREVAGKESQGIIADFLGDEAVGDIGFIFRK